MIALRTLLALTACKARVTCEIFLTLRMRSRISRADAIYRFSAGVKPAMKL
jgi:hypothetical protein